MKHAKEIPEGFQNVLEIMVEKLDAMVYGTMGKVAAPKIVSEALKKGRMQILFC